MTVVVAAVGFTWRQSVLTPTSLVPTTTPRPIFRRNDRLAEHSRQEDGRLLQGEVAHKDQEITAIQGPHIGRGGQSRQAERNRSRAGAVAGAAAPASPADAIRPSKTSAWPSPHPSSARPTPPPQQPSPANSRKNSSGFTPMAQHVEYVPPPMESPRIQELTPGMRDVPAGAPVPPLSIPAAAPEFSPMPQHAPPAGYHAAQQSVPVYSERELLQPAGPPRSFRDGWPHSSVNLGERHKFAAGIGSKELANSLAKTQFVEFVPQKVSRQKVYETDDEVLTSAELVHSWPVRLASSFNSKKALSGAGGVERAARMRRWFRTIRG